MRELNKSLPTFKLQYYDHQINLKIGNLLNEEIIEDGKLIILGVNEGFFPPKVAQNLFLSLSMQKLLSSIKSEEQYSLAKKLLSSARSIYLSSSKVINSTNSDSSILYLDYKKAITITPLKLDKVYNQEINSFIELNKIESNLVSFNLVTNYTKKKIMQDSTYYNLNLEDSTNNERVNLSKQSIIKLKNKYEDSSLDLSYTSLNTYINCSFRYLLTYLIKINKSSNNVIHEGNVNHCTIENYLLKDGGKEQLSLEKVFTNSIIDDYYNLSDSELINLNINYDLNKEVFETKYRKVISLINNNQSKIIFPLDYTEFVSKIKYKKLIKVLEEYFSFSYFYELLGNDILANFYQYIQAKYEVLSPSTTKDIEKDFIYNFFDQKGNEIKFQIKPDILVKEEDGYSIFDLKRSFHALDYKSVNIGYNTQLLYYLVILTLNKINVKSISLLFSKGELRPSSKHYFNTILHDKEKILNNINLKMKGISSIEDLVTHFTNIIKEYGSSILSSKFNIETIFDYKEQRELGCIGCSYSNICHKSGFNYRNLDFEDYNELND
jgi:hypothetical protein